MGYLLFSVHVLKLLSFNYFPVRFFVVARICPARFVVTCSYLSAFVGLHNFLQLNVLQLVLQVIPMEILFEFTQQ